VAKVTEIAIKEMKYILDSNQTRGHEFEQKKKDVLDQR
jgi:hypothetical protein